MIGQQDNAGQDDTAEETAEGTEQDDTAEETSDSDGQDEDSEEPEADND